MVDPSIAALGTGALLSIFFSVFFSMSETALLTASRPRLRFLADNGDKRAQLALHVLKRPRRLLATILIGNTVANIVASVLTTAIALRFFGEFALGIAAGVLTFVLLIVGEITPKTFASEHASWVTLHVVRVVAFFVVLLRPVEWVLNQFAHGLLRVTGTGRVRPAQFHTEEEIKVLLRVGRERGHIGDHEARLIRSVFEFNDLELGDIMQPEPEVRWVRATDSMSRVVSLVAQTGHSRFPVLDDAGQRPLGLVYTKDLMLLAPEQLKALTVGSLVRAMPQFPPEVRVAEALERMQKAGSQMAAVVNASGELVGIVTMEDLLEEIVGDISDEWETARRRVAADRARLGEAESTLRAPATESESRASRAAAGPTAIRAEGEERR